ncbi:MAG: T9SS type A sorting domain-containing protein [Bacteroidetes bacterium]|nr:T9SS type A sorting domain-containing protein [Bacteroidota bacterium]
MKYFFSIISIVLSFLGKAQYLNVPPRLPSMLTGSQYTAQIAALSLTARENSIYNEVISGNVPDFSRTLTPVTGTALIGGFPKSVTYYVLPDYLAIGSDADYFLCPMSPMLATKIADSLGCTLPTRKMVNDIYAQATLTMSPLTIPASGTMTTVQAFAQHNGMVKNQRNGFIPPYSLGTLVAGDKKDVIISNLIYSTANRVIIYGWHTSVGNPIQPMTNVHADTYMDYSHGIRLIQNAVVYNGSPTTIKALLTGSLNPMLSDEGVINPPQYPYGNTVSFLNTPQSFAVINKTNNTLEIKVKNDVDVTHYKIYSSTNGTTFATQTLAKNNLTLTTLSAGQIYFIKIAAYNATYSVTSGTSELLAGVPCSYQDSLLIVNGFDRNVTGNTLDFVRQHAGAAYSNQHYFSSATNEALTDGLVNLTVYKSADWILGKESTANETFNASEQTVVSTYLKQGGKLFVSGSEVGWDLDNNGTAADKSFYNNYLMASYAADAPNSQASTWYKTIKDPSANVFQFNDTCVFDNGSNGTYNVDYPDVISPMNGSSACIKFTNAGSNIAGVAYSGMFTAGSVPGKLVYITFPFETIVSSAKRIIMFQDVWEYFFTAIATSQKETVYSGSMEIYPNPVKDILHVSDNFNVTEIKIYSVQGQLLSEVSNENNISTAQLSPGIYLVEIISGDKKILKKIIKED